MFKKGHTPWNKGKTGLQSQSEASNEKRRQKMTGRKHSKETIDKMKKSHRHLKTFLGKKHSEESRRKISESQKGVPREYAKGENNYRWIKDRNNLKKYEDRRSTAYIEWRKLVYERDGFICRLSDDSCTKDLIAHHIVPWRTDESLRYDVNNGITLCRKHHPLKWADEKAMASKFMELIK